MLKNWFHDETLRTSLFPSYYSEHLIRHYENCNNWEPNCERIKEHRIYSGEFHSLNTYMYLISDYLARTMAILLYNDALFYARLLVQYEVSQKYTPQVTHLYV